MSVLEMYLKVSQERHLMNTIEAILLIVMGILLIVAIVLDIKDKKKLSFYFSISSFICILIVLALLLISNNPFSLPSYKSVCRDAFVNQTKVYYSYKTVDNSEDGKISYYVIGGEQYDKDNVKVVSQISDSNKSSVKVVVTKPVLKKGLSSNELKGLKQALADKDQEEASRLYSGGLPVKSPNFSKKSMKRLVGYYQGDHTNVLITKNVVLKVHD